MEEQEDEEEKEKPDYFYRLICLVVDLGTEVFLKLLLKEIPKGQTVEAFFKSKAHVLNELKNKKVFNFVQQELVNATPLDVLRFDISLLYIIISNLTNIESPIGGWYIACPIPSDPSTGAMLMNMRRVRNEAIAHLPRGKMKKSDFEKYWNEAKDILIELSGEVSQAYKDYVKEEIDQTKVKQLVDGMGNKIEALRLWAEQDRNYEKTLSILEEVNNKIGPMKSSIQAVETQVVDIGPMKTSIQAVETQVVDIGPMKSSIQAVEAQMNTTVEQLDRQSKVLEHMETSIQTMTDQNRPLPGTLSGTEFYLPEITNSQEHNKNVVPDLEESEYLITKTKLRAEIIDHYTQTGCSTTAIPALMDGEEVNIDEIFVMPLMSVRNNMETGRGSRTFINTLHELYPKDGQSIRRVCISGDAGQGKTTLCRKIVSTWCKVHSNNEVEVDNAYQFLKSFSLLFYLPLRNNKLSDVTEMIKTELVRETYHSALKQVLKRESHNCLIIFDGLDEWLPEEDCKYKIPYVDPKEKFTVLITSRPWKLEVLRPKMSEIGQDVELSGINNNKLIKAVVNLLNNKYAKKRNWEEFIYTSDKRSYKENATYEKLKTLAEVPIILTQMVCMWHDNDEEFGHTRVEIYSKMLDYLFHVAEKRHQEVFNSAWIKPQRSTNTQLLDIFKDYTFCEKYTEIVIKLSNLAFHTLFNDGKENALVFPHSVTRIYKLTENDVNFCLFVGILSQTKCPCKASSHTKSISFLHKTFQEFLAALYLASEGKSLSVTFMLQSMKYLNDVFEISQVLIFLIGLRPDLLDVMSQHIAQLTEHDERVLQYRHSFWNGTDFFLSSVEMNLHLPNECVATDGRVTRQLKRLNKVLHYGNYKRHYTNLNIIKRIQNVLYNCIVEVPKQSFLDTKVELRDVALHDQYKAEQMIPYLNLENVKSWCQTRNIHSKAWTKLNCPVKLCIFNELQKDIDHVNSIVERSASSLSCISLRTSGMGIVLLNINNFLTALKKVSHLTCVTFEDVILTHSDIEYLGTIISQCTQLKEINLSRVGCITCKHGQCSYKVNLSRHKKLHDLFINKLDGDIVLSNEVPVERCSIHVLKYAASFLDTLKSSTHLHELLLSDRKLRYHINSTTSTTITVQAGEIDVHSSPLCFAKVLTAVIPTLTNLRALHLDRINFKQDVLKLSPEMTSLTMVRISVSTMSLQCLQGVLHTLPQTISYVEMDGVSICPKEDTLPSKKYIIERFQKIYNICINLKQIEKINFILDLIRPN